MTSEPRLAPRPPRPSRWRRALRRYPQVLQHDASDCAAACLAMITAHYGNPIGVARLRDLANTDAEGATLWSVSRAAETLGFHARGLRLNYEALRDIHLPAIAHWEDEHFVVVFEVRRDSVVVADPSIGQRTLSKDEFLQDWTETALELVPTEQLASPEPRIRPWRRFLPIFWSFKTMIGEVLAASMLLSLLGLGIPFFTQIVVDRVFVTESVSLLNMLAIGMVLIAVFEAVIGGVRSLILIHVSTRFDARLIGDFLRHVFRLPMRFFALRRVGDVVARAEENTTIREALASTLPAMFLDAVMALGYLVLLAFYNLDLTLVVVVVLPVFVGLMWAFTPPMRRNEREAFKKATEASTHLIESVGGIATVKSMAVEPQVRWRLESLFVDSLRVSRRGEHIATTYTVVATLVHTTTAVLFLWLAAHTVLAGEMSIGEMLAFVVIASNVVNPIMGLVESWDELQEARNAAERVNDVFESDPEQQSDGSLLKLKHISGHIRFEDVHFTYTGDDKEATLRGIDLDVAPGERVAIVGRSGSGKSTLMKLILGLYMPTRGRVLIDGCDLRTVSLPELRRRMGVVPQEVFLFSGSVRENIALGNPEVSLEQVVAAAEVADAHEFVCRLAQGYDTKVGERGMHLSGGERQRIALARALLFDPAVLLLDEATSSLDAVSERAIQQSVERAMHGRTTVVIAHRTSTVRHADRIVVLAEGRIVESGVHDELMRHHGEYAALVGQRAEGWGG